MVELVGRLFLAVDLPDEVRALLASALDDWNEGKPLPGKPIPPRNWHLTLRFLGKTGTVTYERLLAALAETPLGPSFRLSLHRLGAFPGPARATVLWIAVSEGAERLVELAELSEEAAGLAGFEAEERPFRPHMTLSRIRPQQDLRPLLERPPPPAIHLRADALTLFRSHLGGGPARYEPLDTFPLT